MRPRRSIIYFLALAVLAAALIVLNLGSRRMSTANRVAHAFPFQLKTILGIENTPFEYHCFVADVDLDGDDDLLVNRPDRCLWYRLHESGLALAGEGLYERPGRTQMAADSDGDGRPEFFVLMETSRGWMMSCHNWFSPDGPSVPTYTLGPLFPLDEATVRPWRRTRFFGSVPGLAGGKPAIIIGRNPLSGEDTCREVLSFDGATGRQMWRFKCASVCQDLAWDDFGTGVPCIVFTTIASGKEFVVDGIRGDASYLYCFDRRDAQAIWRKRLGGAGASGMLKLADLNADGRKEIIVARSVPPRDSVFVKDPRAWVVAALNGDGEILASQRLPVRPGAILAADLDGDSRSEILVDGAEAKLYILDHDLSIERVLSPPPLGYFPKSSVYDVRDIGGDEKPEIIGWLDSALVVRNREGNIIARRKCAQGVLVKIARFDGRNHILAEWPDSIRIMALLPVPLAERLRANARSLTIWIAAVTLIALLVVRQVRRLLKWHRERRMTFEAEQNELLIAMVAFDHGGSSLRIMDRIRFHLKNWERIRTDGATREELLAKLRKTYTETVVPELRHIVILARRARVPERIWSSLLAEAELAGKEVEAISTSGPEGPARQGEHIAKALATLDVADGSIARIRSHLRSVFRTPVGEALDRLIARFRYEHGESGIAFRYATDTPAAAAVFISPVAFERVFEALLTNAVRATEGKAGAEIALAVQEEGDYCRVDVRDNGCGIPRDDWDRVFDRQYTTKTDGGGFGLYYAREELAKFQAKIYVLDSAEGGGTTMRVVLRKSEKAGTA